MSDFAIYKQLLTANFTSNEQFSGNTTGTGAANAVSQACTRERALSIANLSAASAEGVMGGSRVPYTALLKTMTVTGNLAAVANTTDYSVVNLFARTGNAAARLIGTANLANVAVVKLVPIAGVLASNAQLLALTANDIITANNAVTGNGTANNMQLAVDFTFEDV